MPDRGKTSSAYEALIAPLDGRNVSYRLIDHEHEGRTGKVSAMRGHSVAEARLPLLCTSRHLAATRNPVAIRTRTWFARWGNLRSWDQRFFDPILLPGRQPLTPRLDASWNCGQPSAGCRMGWSRIDQLQLPSIDAGPLCQAALRRHQAAESRT
jgi:hypothetical protein